MAELKPWDSRISSYLAWQQAWQELQEFGISDTQYKDLQRSETLGNRNHSFKRIELY